MAKFTRSVVAQAVLATQTLKELQKRLEERVRKALTTQGREVVAQALAGASKERLEALASLPQTTRPKY
jgi:hypothetical protein